MMSCDPTYRRASMPYADIVAVFSSCCKRSRVSYQPRCTSFLAPGVRVGSGLRRRRDGSGFGAHALEFKHIQ